MIIIKKPIIAVIMIALLLSCSKTTYKSIWQLTPVNADGFSYEWSIPLRFSDSGSKLNYSITNDSEDLYISLRITEEQTQMKIMNAGFQVGIDTTGKKASQAIIKFPKVSN